MAKIMLVEDDNSLREIYEARLAAEGYQVVSARDGEEALAMALKEHPDLIIADIMMPKVSGFDMLDILRSTPETKNTKIIIMTALSQAEDKARAEKLGADRYLVKSQVTLEDVTREARAILNELESQASATVAKVTGSAPTTPAPPPPATPAPNPVAATPTAPTPAPAAQPTSTSVTSTVTTIPVTAPDDDHAETKEALAETAKSLSEPVKKEEAEVAEQVDDFIASNPTLSASADTAAKTTGPAPSEPPQQAEPKKDQSKANNAVDSLTSSGVEPAPAEKNTDEAARPYVGTDKSTQKAQGGMEHTKRIEPTPESARAAATPDLNALMAKEGESITNDSTPAVNSIITPNDTGGSPPTT